MVGRVTIDLPALYGWVGTLLAAGEDLNAAAARIASVLDEAGTSSSAPADLRRTAQRCDDLADAVTARLAIAETLVDLPVPHPSIRAELIERVLTLPLPDWAVDPWQGVRDLVEDEIVQIVGKVAGGLRGIDKGVGDWLRTAVRVTQELVVEIEEQWHVTRHTLVELRDGTLRALDELSVRRSRTVRAWLEVVVESDDALRRFGSWLGSAKGWLGPPGDAIGFATPATQQWEQDAVRTDLSQTERALRAATASTIEGLVRAVASGFVTAGAVTLMAVTPLTGGASAAAAAAMIAGGGYAADRMLDKPLERGIDWWLDHTGSFYEGVAKGIDDAGRAIGPVAEVGEGISEFWNKVPQPRWPW